MSITMRHAWFLAISGLGLVPALGSCGKVAEDGDPVFDSNTNWLIRCREDDQCSGSLRCYCGMCSKPCGQDAECGLLSGAACAESGESLCGEQASAGGLCVLACTQSADCGPGFECNTAQCVPKPCTVSTLQSWDELFQTINVDLSRSDTDETSYLRYVTLGGGPDVDDSGGSCGLALDVKRKGLSKLLNSLSISASIRLPQPIDAAETLYRIDLRDYSWDRLVLVGGAYGDAWEAFVANDPYALPFIGDDADDLVAATGSLVPVLQLDHLIAAVTSPEVYYGVLAIPERLDAYVRDELGVASAQPSVEAGFVDGETAFLAQYWQLGVRTGFLWDIADFGLGWGQLRAHPLDAPSGPHELVFTLPNGLPAFAFTAAGSVRIAAWGGADAAEPDGLARVPRSNWRRHARTVNVRDELRDWAAANPDLYPGNELTLVRQRFPGPEALALLLQRDFETFLAPALAQLEIDPDAPDPVLESYAEFQRPVTLEVAAAELLVMPQDLRENLDLLDPALRSLDGGTVGRDVFSRFYSNAVCVLSVVLENQPPPDLCDAVP